MVPFPVPVVVILPGERVSVQIPVAGSPVISTLPVARMHVGWVMVPTTGTVGVTGWVLITTFDDEEEAHPSELVTVKVYIPAVSPVIVVLVPVPIVVAPPGVVVTVHELIDGKPLKTTLPAEDAHVVWVMIPITGAVGVKGWEGITTLEEREDVQPASLVTV